MTIKKLDDSKYNLPTRLIHGKSYSPEWEYTHHVVPPLTTSSTFRLDSAKRGAQGFSEIGNRIVGADSNPIYVYDRMGEPNVDMLQHALAVAEGGEVCVTFASGMGAVHAASSFALNKNSEVIAHRTLYGCTYSLFTNWFPKCGFPVHFVDFVNPLAHTPHINDNTRVIYLESPVNPTLELLDLEAIVKSVKEINKTRSDDKKIITVIDNTFATPFCQRPLELGIDVVLHSLTKGISGFGVDMGGAVITRKEFWGPLIVARKDFGATLSPHVAWNVQIFGLSTLPLRLPKQQANAQAVAEFLEKHPLVEYVNYPGLPSFKQHDLAKRMMKDYNGNFAPGTVLYFALKGNTPSHSKDRGESMMDFIAENAYAVTLAVSLGQIRTLIEHPGSMTHSAYPAEEQMSKGMHPGGIRLAVGLEDASDIIKDLTDALTMCGKK